MSSGVAASRPTERLWVTALIVFLLLAPLGAWVGASCGLYASQGCWSWPPPADETVAHFEVVEVADPAPFGRSGAGGPNFVLARADDQARDDFGDPRCRVAAALLRAGKLPRTSGQASSEARTWLERVLADIDHHRGDLAPELFEGRDAAGRRVVVAAVLGPEIMNDVRGYWEVAARIGEDGSAETVADIHYGWNTELVAWPELDRFLGALLGVSGAVLLVLTGIVFVHARRTR